MLVVVFVVGLNFFNKKPAEVAAVPDFSPEKCIASTATPKKGVLGLAVLAAAEPEALPLIKDLGVQLVRVEFRWDHIEPVQGEYNWGLFDGEVADLYDNKVDILATIDHAPVWAHEIETLAVDFGVFLEAFVERYGERIELYEIFNEPNLPGYGWAFELGNVAHDAKLYASMIVKANEVIRPLKPEALIMSGGLSPDNNPETFARHMYEHLTPGCFYIFSFHPYGRGDRLVGVQAEWSEFLAAQGDVGKPVWFAEFGTSDEETVEEVLMQVDVQLPDLGAVVWFSLHDLKPAGWNFGLVEYNWDKKPGYEQFKEVIRNHQ